MEDVMSSLYSKELNKKVYLEKRVSKHNQKSLFARKRINEKSFSNKGHLKTNKKYKKSQKIYKHNWGGKF